LQHVGALIETPAFYPQLSGAMNLRIFARLANIDPGNIDQLLCDVGLDGSQEILFSRYSLGMKQKLGIAAALLKNPSILILDEPVNGLDPEAVIEIRKILEDKRDSGAAILISSHLLAELELLSDRFICIDNGEITFSGSKNELFATSKKRILLKPEYRADVNLLAHRLQESNFEVDHGEESIEIVVEHFHQHSLSAEVNRLASSWGIWLEELSIKSDSLEERFFSA
jgi:ABC-2 type transport system ATP-binding protein